MGGRELEERYQIKMLLSSVFETAVAAECRDTEARPFQILSRFTQPHRLCSWSQSEIYQNLDSNSAATLGPRAQVNYTSFYENMYCEYAM